MTQSNSPTLTLSIYPYTIGYANLTDLVAIPSE